MTCQVLVTLKSFATHATLIRPVLIVTLLVAIQVFLPLQACPADVTDMWSLFVILEVLVKCLAILESVCTLGAMVNQHT